MGTINLPNFFYPLAPTGGARVSSSEVVLLASISNHS